MKLGKELHAASSCRLARLGLNSLTGAPSLRSMEGLQWGCECGSGILLKSMKCIIFAICKFIIMSLHHNQSNVASTVNKHYSY